MITDNGALIVGIVNEKLKLQCLEQINRILRDWKEIRGTQYTHNVDSREATNVLTRAKAAIRKISGESSTYMKQAEVVGERWPKHPGNEADEQCGILEALKVDLESGLLETLEEQIHGDLFADYLEMAEHLLSEHFKDAAAVIGGSTLEAHLRQLAVRLKIPIDVEDASGTPRPKKADRLNSDLAQAGAYSKIDQKNVTAWLGLRNDAAHGHYDKYDGQQVRTYLEGIRHFVTKYPA